MTCEKGKSTPENTHIRLHYFARMQFNDEVISTSFEL